MLEGGGVQRSQMREGAVRERRRGRCERGRCERGQRVQEGGVRTRTNFLLTIWLKTGPLKSETSLFFECCSFFMSSWTSAWFALHGTAALSAAGITPDPSSEGRLPADFFFRFFFPSFASAGFTLRDCDVLAGRDFLAASSSNCDARGGATA